MTQLRLVVVGSAALVLALTTPGVAQQPPARDAGAPALTGTCALGGVVTSDDGQGRPIRRATVNISGGDLRLSRVTATDDRGRFVIPDLGPGRYTVNVSKPGWVTTFLGARRPGRGPGLAIVLTEGQQVTDLAVKLTPGSVITGRILDQNGVPQSGVRPMVMQYRTLGGERVLTQAQTTTLISIVSMTTDDRGEYRIFGLAPGTYYIAASMPAAGGRLTTNEEIAWAQQRQAIPGGTSFPVPPPGPAIAFPPIYYPGTTNLQQASPINLAAGEERRGIDLVLQPVMTARVAGRVTGHDGQPARAVQVVISAVGAKSSLEAARQAAVSDQNGVFEFASVIPGQYTLSARGSTQPASPPPAPGDVPFAAAGLSGGRTLDLWAAAEITVSSQDVTGLAIALEPGLTISGRVAFDATTLVPPADFSRVQITVSAARQASSVAGMPTNMHAAPVRADGTFQLAGIAPDNYVITGYVHGGLPDTSWMVKSVTMGGENVADRPVAIKSAARSSEVVITFTDRHAELAGRLLDTAGRPAPEYFVFVFSTNRSYWTPNATRQLRPPTRPASDGTYRLTALPPGEYFVAALTEVDDADIYDAAFLEQVAAAAFKITIAEGEKKKQDLQIGNR